MTTDYQYITELFHQNPQHKEAFDFKGVDGLKELGDETSQIIIEWLEN